MSRYSICGLAAALALLVTLSACSEMGVGRSEGEKLYRKYCAECHGLDAAGKVPKYRSYEAANLLDDTWKFGGDPTSLKQTILDGSFPMMPAFDHLSTDEIDALIRYIRELRSGN